ncbi:MAG: hypothetical protein Q9190_002084 [Brigantiaea leucoxantha]
MSPNPSQPSSESSSAEPGVREISASGQRALNPNAPVFVASPTVAQPVPFSLSHQVLFEHHAESSPSVKPSTTQPPQTPLEQQLHTLKEEKRQILATLMSYDHEAKALKDMIEGTWRLYEDNPQWSRAIKDRFLDRISRADYQERNINAAKARHQRRITEIEKDIEKTYARLATPDPRFNTVEVYMRRRGRSVG